MDWPLTSGWLAGSENAGVQVTPEAPALQDRGLRPRAPARTPAGSPLVTIAIPAFSRPALLELALRSAFAQTSPARVEVIVCDDGLLPQTRTVVDRYRHLGVRYHENRPALGGVGNWNRCLSEARGKWVTVLHEDDILFPWFVESVTPRLRAGVSAVSMAAVRGAEPPAMAAPGPSTGARLYRPAYFVKSSMSPFPGVMVHRRTALRIGGFDPSWGPVADYEFWYRLAQAGRVEVLGATGAFYRIGPGQWTERAWERMLALSHLLRLRIAREQFPGHRRAGKWAARFFTWRNARCYRSRFGEAAVIRRCARLGRSALSGLPSGWVWAALRFASRASPIHSVPSNDGRTSPIRANSGGPYRILKADTLGGSQGIAQAPVGGGA
jgi:glycosyltransferase involved in cell wall biosynthesis